MVRKINYIIAGIILKHITSYMRTNKNVINCRLTESTVLKLCELDIAATTGVGMIQVQVIA